MPPGQDCTHLRPQRCYGGPWGSPFLTLVLLAALAVLDAVEGVQAGAVGRFALVLAVAVGLSGHRDGARDGGREGGKLRLRIRVAVLPGRTEEWSLLNVPRLGEPGWQRSARSGAPQSRAGRSPGSCQSQQRHGCIVPRPGPPRREVRGCASRITLLWDLASICLSCRDLSAPGTLRCGYILCAFQGRGAVTAGKQRDSPTLLTHAFLSKLCAKAMVFNGQVTARWRPRPRHHKSRARS